MVVMSVTMVVASCDGEVGGVDVVMMMVMMMVIMMVMMMVIMMMVIM